MKIILISQRVDIVPSYGERRDALDQNWSRFLNYMGYCAIPVPNNLNNAKRILENIEVHGILLTGGNTPVLYGGQAKERDKLDEFLIQRSLELDIPLIGVCRGMQSISLYFKNELEKIAGHVAVTHFIHGKINRKVNSYHEYTVNLKNKDLEVLAKSEDGQIEAIKHKDYKIYGIMWHPERVMPFCEEDSKLFLKIFQ